MNQPSSQIKAMRQKLFKAKSGAFPVKKLHPKRDWIIGIVIGLGIALAIISWSVYAYVANRDGGVSTVEVTVANPSYQAALVDQALASFEAKAVNFAANAAAISIPVGSDESELDETSSTTTATSTDEIAPVTEDAVVEVDQIPVNESAVEVIDDEETTVELIQ